MTKKLQAAAELAALLSREIAQGHGASDRPNPAPFMIADDTVKLLQLGARAARLALQRCNGIERYSAAAGRVVPQWTEADAARADRAEQRIANAAGKIAASYSATVTVGGDPRGFVLWLHLKSGSSNSMGGRESGWGVA